MRIIALKNKASRLRVYLLVFLTRAARVQINKGAPLPEKLHLNVFKGEAPYRRLISL